MYLQVPESYLEMPKHTKWKLPTHFDWSHQKYHEMNLTTAIQNKIRNKIVTTEKENVWMDWTNNLITYFIINSSNIAAAAAIVIIILKNLKQIKVKHSKIFSSKTILKYLHEEAVTIKTVPNDSKLWCCQFQMILQTSLKWG